MSRSLDPSLSTALSNGLIIPVFLVMITFRSSVQYLWTGVGNLVFGGNTFTGVGSLGKIGTVSEGIGIAADGTTLTLSGIDPVLLSDSLTDLRSGAPATIWFGLLTSAGTLIGTPYQLFSGTVDEPSISVGPKTISISIALENRLIDLARPSNRRYTSADQRISFPNDSAFAYVEQLNDLALNWGE